MRRCTPLVIFALLVAAPATPAGEPARPSPDELRGQARRCRQLLKTSVIDFYLPACVDREHGGYLESLKDGRFAPAGEKFLTLQARQVWFFSTLAAAGVEKEAARAAAKTGFDFLEGKFRDRVHGGYFAKVSDDGRPTDRRKHVYLNAFALYALAAYHRATGDAAALAAARDLFHTLEAKAHDAARGGYTEFFEEDWRPVTDPKAASYVGPPGTKTFNTHLHVLEALTELYRAWPDALVRRRLEELLTVNTLTVRLPEHGCNVDGFTPDWRPIDTPRNLRASYGHDVEGAWLCLDAARALGRPPALLRGWAEGLVGYSLRHGYDREHGGFFYTGPLGKDADDTKKEWWVQAEALVSMLELYKLTGRPEYYAAFAGTLDFVAKHQVAKEGGWWATRAADGSPAGPSRTSMWQGAYHNGRSMLLCAKLLGELAAAGAGPAPPAGGQVGVFEGHGDVGAVQHPGSVRYNEAAKTYTVTGSGENMWFDKDAFHFAWVKADGDVAVAADVAFVGPGKNRHRKACLMIRQGLEADSAYVDVAVHGDGLTSLQFRDARGAATHEVQANVAAPARVRLVRRGKYALLYLAPKGEPLRFSGAAVQVALDGPVYVGIGVCSHDKDVTETAVFSNVELATKLAPIGKPALYSTLETQAMASTDRRVVSVTPGRIEAPNWLRDGQTLVYNSGGRLYRIPAAGGEPQAIDTGFATRCNNDHGVSPDGKLLAISDQSQGDRKSRVYTLPVEGGTPRLVTPNGPSYWHGWSPDGKTLAYCAERNGEFDVYTIPVGGGPETRLTTAKGLDDGPEFSPDGRHIYFNSDRTGRMQLWRMKADGSGQEQLTDDEFNNWFPHPSPDGRALVFLSYAADVKGHPADKDVTLRRMTLADRKIDVLGRFLGGQGTVNVPCWSPDGRRIAFVTYQLVPEK